MGQCTRCQETRGLLNKEGLCIFCLREMENKEEFGTVVKVNIIGNYHGKEIKSDNLKRNSWMGK
jgi:hypothetical protein